MNNITQSLLSILSDWKGGFKGAFNIREDGACAGRQSSENIQIDSKKDLPGLDIHIKAGTKGETVYIPACVTHGNVDDLVYNDFFVGEGADVTIVAAAEFIRILKKKPDIMEYTVSSLKKVQEFFTKKNILGQEQGHRHKKDRPSYRQQNC